MIKKQISSNGKQYSGRKEMRLYEKKLEPSFDMMINEFGELSNEIDTFCNR